MSGRSTTNDFALWQDQEELDLLSNITVQSGNYSVNLPDPAVTAERSQRMHAFLADPPFKRRSQSVAASQAAMAQRIAAFDLTFDGPAPPRRSTR